MILSSDHAYENPIPDILIEYLHKEKEGVKTLKNFLVYNILTPEINNNKCLMKQLITVHVQRFAS